MWTPLAIAIPAALTIAVIAAWLRLRSATPHATLASLPHFGHRSL